MGSAHQLWVLRNVSLELLGCYCVSKRVDFDHLMWISQKKISKHNWSSQGILGWDWGGTLKGYGLIAWCDEPYAILYYYDVFFCHHWQVLLSTLQLASLRGSKFMNLIRATLRVLVHTYISFITYLSIHTYIHWHDFRLKTAWKSIEVLTKNPG